MTKKTLKHPEKVLMGDRIRRERKFLGLTVEQLAEKLDISAKFMADIETGAKGMSMKSFYNLVRVLNTSADYLLFGDAYAGRKRLVCEVRRYYVEELAPWAKNAEAGSAEESTVLMAETSAEKTENQISDKALEIAEVLAAFQSGEK